MERKTEVRVFSSFEEENTAEHRRLAGMPHDDRSREFAVLQARRWGDDWDQAPIENRVTWERVSWYRCSDRPRDLADADELAKIND